MVRNLRRQLGFYLLNNLVKYKCCFHYNNTYKYPLPNDGIMHIKTLKQRKEENQIFLDIMESLKKAKALQCDHCGKECYEYCIALLIDFKNITLISRSCTGCMYKQKYGRLNKNDYDFIMRLENVQGHVQWFSELNEMNPKERLKSITHSLKFSKITLKELEKEAIKKGLKLFIR